MRRKATERRLAAIMFTDIVGYTALMGRDEAAGRRVRERHRTVVGAVAGQYGGDVVDENGDELVLTFASALDATSCALALQQRLRAEPELQVRAGIHLGDVVFEAGRVYGDGVNLAARVRALAEPGGICVTGEVWQTIRNQPNVAATPLGEQHLKNVDRPVAVYAVSGAPAQPTTTQPAPAAASRTRLGRWLAAGVVVAALALASTWWLSRPAEPGPIRSLAVLPFENLMRDPDQDYFVDGMTESLIAELAKVRSLRVISRTSAMQYRGTRKTAPEIARELGVEGLIEGSVLREGDQVRVTVQLIHGPTDSHLWADTYTNALTDVLRLHSNLALAITGAVGAALTADESLRIGARGSIRPDAYEAYLKGMHLLEELTEAGLRSAIGQLERATQLEPGFALAWAQMSTAYRAFSGWAIAEPRSVMPLARRAALRALELDPSLGRAHWALAGVAHAYDWEWQEAERLYLRGIELGTSEADAHVGYALLLLQLGRSREAVREAEIGLGLDPRSRWVRRNASLVFLLAGNRSRSWEIITQLLEEDPAFVGALEAKFWNHLAMGDFENAIRAANQYATASPDERLPYMLVALGSATAGRSDAARRAVEGARETFGEGRIPHTYLGLIQVELGELDRAFRSFDRGFEEREWMMVWLRVLPYQSGIAARLRREPRYWDLMRRMGFPPFPPEHPGYAEEQARLARAP